MSPVDVWTSNKPVPATYELLSDINYIYNHISIYHIWPIGWTC